MPRPLDLIVFGATGFTGRRVAAELARVGGDLRWAVCGRQASAVQALTEALSQQPCPPRSVVVDLHDEAGLGDAWAQAGLALSCVGPFARLGEPVVRACVQAGTDLMDIAGEPAYMRRILTDWDAPARQAGVSVIHACGFDAMVADLGWLRLTRAAEARGHEITTVTSFLELQSGPQGVRFHATTLDALVLGLAEKTAPPPGPVPRRPGNLALRKMPFRDPTLGRWCTMLPSADPAVVRISQERLAATTGQPQPRYLGYFAFERPGNIAASAVAGGALLGLSKARWGRQLMVRHPAWFTLGHATDAGPTEDQLARTRFRMTLRAHVRGREEPVATHRIEGPEPGYVSTPILLASAALGWLETPDGDRARGVHPPATALPHLPILAEARDHRCSLSHLE